MELTQQIVFTFFRMGLVTGIVERQAVIDWADRKILESAVPDPHIIELSLANDQPYSQLIGLLNQLLQGFVAHELPLKLLFAQAGRLLETKPSQAREFAQGLVLLLAEEFLPREVRNELCAIEGDLELFQLSMLSYQSLKNHLAGFLSQYKIYETTLAELKLE